MAAWICKKCSDSGYILRVELRALADKMHMVHEKKRIIKPKPGTHGGATKSKKKKKMKEAEELARSNGQSKVSFSCVV